MNDDDDDATLDGPILLDPEMLLAIDDAKKVGNIEPIRKTSRYKEMAATMDARVLDEFCQQAMMLTPALPEASRKQLLDALYKPDPKAH